MSSEGTSADSDLETRLEERGIRKETGSYYTPEYIVDYIVEETVAPQLDDNDDLDELSVLDPACGAGDFLLGALEFIAAERQRRNPYLSAFEARRRTAEHNLYGVDILPEAAERTRQNLREAVAEPGSEPPELDLNIKVGNSLVGSTIDDLPVDVSEVVG